MEEKIKGRCPICNEETFPIYFNDDGKYKGVTYTRCLPCDQIFINKNNEENN